MECRNKQVTRNEEEFHVGFEGKSIVDTIMQSKMGHAKNKGGNFVCKIQDVTKGSRERVMGSVLPRTQVGDKCQEATDVEKIAKGMWWGVWEGQGEVAHCRCWGGKERSLLPCQFVVLTQQLHPTGCWKQAPLAQTSVCLFVSVGA